VPAPPGPQDERAAPAGRRRPFYGWYVAGFSILIYFFTNGLSVFVPQNLAPRLMESFGASAAQIGRTSLVTFAVTACLAPFAGALVDRLGVLRVMRGGLVVLGIAFCAYPFVRTLGQLYVLHAFLGVGLASAGLLVNVVLLSRWFVARRGLVVGALASGSSLAGAALPLAISPWVTDPALGWRYGYGALAAAFWLLAALPAFLVLREDPAAVGQHPDGQAARPAGAGAGGPGEGATLGEALRSPTLWCLALGSACLWFSIQAVTSQVTIFLEREAGYAPAEATRLFSLIFGLSFFGKFLYGALSDWFPKRHVMLAASLTLLAGCLLLLDPGAGGLALATDPARLTAFAVVFGLGFGGSFTMIQLTVVESFGQRELGRILGVVIFVDSLAGGIGPAVAGQLATSTGTYLAPFALVAGVALFACINVLFIRPLRRA
jgi:MFS family permease